MKKIYDNRTFIRDLRNYDCAQKIYEKHLFTPSIFCLDQYKHWSKRQ